MLDGLMLSIFFYTCKISISILPFLKFLSGVVFAMPCIIFAALQCIFSSGSKTSGEHVPQTDILYVALGNSPLK